MDSEMQRPAQRSSRFRLRAAVAAAGLGAAAIALALDGQPGIHDPSTIAIDKGRYYTYGTGNGLPASVSDDGWTWRRQGTLMQAVPGGRAGPAVLARGGSNTWAPDVIRVGDRFYVYYSAPATQPRSAIGLLIGKTLDPDSPDYKFEDAGPVVWSDGIEDSNAIDPGLLRDSTDGRLWMVYGSYFGYIRLVELDPRTGLRKNPSAKAVDIAINSEAPILIQRDGWYYLLVTHGSCCAGANSTYNIRVGRSRKVTGPYLDNMGVDMIEGGGKLFAGSTGRMIGPGHFGLLDLGQGVQKFSLHYEADLDRGGISVLDIKPLLWRDGWPVAGENLRGGDYVIESVRQGTVLELAVQGVPVGGNRGRGGGPGAGAGRAGGAGGPGAPGAGPGGGRGAGPGGPGAGAPGDGRGAGGPPGAGPPGGGRGGGPAADAAPAVPIPAQDATQVSANWPAGALGARLAPQMLQAQQHWRITPAPQGGGYPGSPYWRISIAGTDRTLAATADGELTVLPAFSGAPEQLWRIDQLTDGSYRVMPKALSGWASPPALSAVGFSMPTLSAFNPDSDRHRWIIKAP
jgi:arabinan endo-1,5-alpha-L-arabinosidase